MMRMKSFVGALAVLALTALAGSYGCVRVVADALGVDAGKRTKITAEMNVMVPMRDGVKLATDIYRPSAGGPYPAVLTRLPYGSDTTMFKELGRLFARNGYVFVVQDTRGEFDSEGAWFPLIWEYNDGHDTVEWVKSQPWCDGKIGMWGGSYFGYTQLTAAPDDPDLTCMVPIMATGSMRKIIFRGGALELVTTQGWLAMERTVQNQRKGIDKKVEPQLSGGFYNEPIRDAVPVDFEKEIKDPAMIAAGPEAWLVHPGDVEHIPPLDFEPYYSKVSAPSLLVGGWYDIFLGAQLYDFNRFRKDGEGDAKETRIIIGPWVHGMPSSKFEKSILTGPRMIVGGFMDWYDFWLKGVDNGADKQAPLKLFIMGENVWRDEYEWPLARTRFTNYFLHGSGNANTDRGDGFLSTAEPQDETADAYDYDPRNPVPTKGGSFLGTGDYQPGAQDQDDVAGRPDVLVYMTPALDAPLEVTGPLILTLYASSSAKDTDWVAKLLDVDEKGKARILQEGIVRARYRNGYQHPTAIEPGEVYEYTLDMWATANLFKKGHRVALWVTSSDFPQFDRNTNAAGEGGPDNIVVAHQQVYHDERHPSHLVLPVIPR